MTQRGLGLVALWLVLVAAAPAPRPLTPPPPELSRLVPFAEAPLDKPPVTLDLALPAAPVDLPTLPLVAVGPPAADKPIAFLQSPRSLPCIGAWLGVASESLECGRARLGRGEYDEAAKALEAATRAGSDRDLLREARYWLGETYYRLGRVEQADWLFRQVAHDAQKSEWTPWSLHSSGWTALRLGDAVRARDAFTQLLAGPLPSPLEGWGRHGLGLAQYALGRHQDAERAWALLATRGVPPVLTRDVLFWHGETLGRLGEFARAEEELTRFTAGGPHALLAAGLLAQGWWALAAGHAAPSASAFRAFLAQPAVTVRMPAGAAPARDWAEAGLALAQIAGGNWSDARALVAGLATRRSPLALPMQLRLARGSLAAPLTSDPDAVITPLLAADLTPPVRGWVLLVKGEAARGVGNRDDARTQFDLARQAQPTGIISQQAALRVAMANFELREFTQTLRDLAPVLNARVEPPVRLLALLLEGEAAYYAADYPTAAAAYRRALQEFPADAQAPATRLALAWTALRQGRGQDARKEFLDFATAAPEHPNAPDAVLLASELSMTAGDLAGARALVDRLIGSYPANPRVDFARLNRAILLVRGGDFAAAEPALRDWLSRGPFPALLGRAHAALAVTLLARGNAAEAATEFGAAQREGLGPFASLGFGATALSASRWDDAARAFTQARDTGTPDIAAAAEYGLAVVAFHRGGVRDFRKPALAALSAAPAGPGAPALLYTLTGIAVEDKDWQGGLGFARRLVNQFPSHEAADDALERVGAGAAAVPQWPVVYEAYTLMRQKYAQSPFVDAGRIRFAEAQLETGRGAQARQELEQFVAASPNDPRAAHALILLARIREAAGDRQGALEAYSRAARDSQGPEWSTAALSGHARLLTADRRWDQARGVFERLLKNPDTGIAADAAKGIGDTYAGEGDQLAAAEYYLTAAYLTPSSPAGRRGLLAAARALAALKQTDAAAIAYRKLLAQTDVPSDLADAARQGLAAISR